MKVNHDFQVTDTTVIGRRKPAKYYQTPKVSERALLSQVIYFLPSD